MDFNWANLNISIGKAVVIYLPVRCFLGCALPLVFPDQHTLELSVSVL